MYEHKHHIILSAVVVLLVSLFGLVKTVKILAQTDTTNTPVSIPTCNFTYTDWTSCVSGYQTRTINSREPSGCYGGTPETRRTCTMPTCAFNYSAWSNCNTSGYQTRTVTSTTPSGCTGGSPEINRSCTYTYPVTGTTTTTPVTCAFNYSAWSACNTSGYQTRTVTSATPSGCTGGSPEIRRDCTYTYPTTGTTTTAPITCAFNYSAWSACNTSGYQTRTVTSATPSGCTGGSPEINRSCTYTYPVTGTTTTTCSYTYSNWNPCQSTGTQTRNVLSVYPTNCSGTPLLSNRCTFVSATTANQTASIDCTPSCSSWGNCEQNGYKSRSCVAPYGCPQGSWTEKNTCTYNTDSAVTALATIQSNATTTTDSKLAMNCIYQCSPWSICRSEGYQERMCQKPYGLSCLASQEKRACSNASSAIATTDSVICLTQQCSNWSACSPAGIRFQNCWPAAAGCSRETKTNTQTCAPTICKFTYADWGNCVDGLQFRTIVDASPSACVGGESILKQNCTVAPENNEEPATVAVSENQNEVAQAPIDPEIIVSNDWKKEEFKTDTCQDKICGGNADPDNDGLSNNDEFRYGTDPMNRDTDHDGKTDGEEIASGNDPLKSSAKGETDAMAFENPKETGIVKSEIYQVTNVEMMTVAEGTSKQIKLTGKGPASSYITVYVYSEQPVIVTVKTDSNGDWTYTFDRELENGEHEAYVAVTTNSGSIKSKSAALPFIKTANAITTASAVENNIAQSTAQSGMNFRMLFLIMGISLFGVMVAIILIGLVIKKVAERVKK